MQMNAQPLKHSAFLPTSLFAFEVEKKDNMHLWELGYFLAGRFTFMCVVG